MNEVQTQPDVNGATLAELARRCVLRAPEKGVTFATAESCTGGLVAHLVTDIPGASAAFQGGWVVYDNQRKANDLGVDPLLLERHGAVSEQVARALAEGARERAETTFGVATTGVAGPHGGTQEKPVGTVWLAVAGPDGVHTEHFVSPGDGDRVHHKQAFAYRTLELLLDAIEAHPDRPSTP